MKKRAGKCKIIEKLAKWNFGPKGERTRNRWHLPIWIDGEGFRDRTVYKDGAVSWAPTGGRTALSPRFEKEEDVELPAPRGRESVEEVTVRRVDLRQTQRKGAGSKAGPPPSKLLGLPHIETNPRPGHRSLRRRSTIGQPSRAGSRAQGLEGPM